MPTIELRDIVSDDDWDAVMGLRAGSTTYIDPIDEIRLEADEERREAAVRSYVTGGASAGSLQAVGLGAGRRSGALPPARAMRCWTSGAGSGPTAEPGWPGLDDVWVGRDGAATARLVRGHLLAVDSQFGFPAPWSARHRATAARRP